MKALTALFTVLALGVIVIGTTVPAALASDQDSVATTQAEAAMKHLAALVPLRSAPAFSTAPILAACTPSGGDCEDSPKCCSGTCMPPPPGTPKGTKGKCK